MSDIAYCAVYVNLDAPKGEQLVVTRPFFKTPMGPVAVLQTLRLEKASGVCVGGPTPSLRRYCRELESKDKNGALVAEDAPGEVLNTLAEIAYAFDLTIEHYQLGPNSERSPLVPKVSESDLNNAVQELVMSHLSVTKGKRQLLQSSFKVDGDMAVLAVYSPCNDQDKVSAWSKGLTTIRDGVATTSMVINTDSIGSWRPGSEQLAWSLWVRTGRRWNFSESTEPK